MKRRLLRGPRAAIGLAALLAATLTLAFTPSAQASGPDDLAFAGGGVEVLVVDPSFTEASFQNLHFEFGGCDDPHVVSCTWEVWAELVTAPDKACDPHSPSTEVWRSEKQSDNGVIDSGPVSFGLLGCKGQILVLWFSYFQSFGNWGDEPPPVVVGSGLTTNFQSTHLGYSPLAEAEQAVIDASPAARPDPMPTPAPFLHASSDCRSFYFGDKRYAFRFQRLGCWKATKLAKRSWFGASPTGYSCSFPRRDGQAGRCVSKADPRKFYAWHPPHKPAAP